MRILTGLLIAGVCVSLAGSASARDADIPHIVERQGRHALFVDGAPYMMLAAQMNNSSGWPAALPHVWPTMEALHVNTVEAPISWEQIEPKEGHFDFSYLDILLAQARQRNLHLVLAWFGTWKNTNPQFTPDWVKLDNKRFPRMRRADGTFHYALSPFGQQTLEADSKAFAALMRHLKQVDTQNTVLMVQVENEAGSYGLVRDHSAKANALFAGPVPALLVQKLGRKPGTWSQVFGRDAQVAFQSWYIARYIDAVAAAGKAVKPLPMYANAALPNEADTWQDPVSYASGGPVPGMIDVWKAAAPHIDALAPDLYNPDRKAYIGFLNAYQRKDNPLLVVETGKTPDYARYFFEAAGRGAIGWAPFGLDGLRYANDLPVRPRFGPAEIAPFAANFALFRPMDRLWARLAFEGKTWGCAEPNDPKSDHTVILHVGRYDVKVRFGAGDFGNGEAKGNPTPSGGVAIAQLGPAEFLVTGFRARVDFALAKPGNANLIYDRVEQGHYDPQEKWVFERVWNGDQVDWGLNFSAAPQILHVRLATYPRR